MITANLQKRSGNRSLDPLTPELLHPLEDVHYRPGYDSSILWRTIDLNVGGHNNISNELSRIVEGSIVAHQMEPRIVLHHITYVNLFSKHI